MPDYIYLLENRLSADQQQALRIIREVVRDSGTLLFLAGSAVRDLTSGHAVREMEIVVHSNALKLKKALEKAGGKVWGEDDASRTLYLCFPGTVRVDLVSAHRAEYPKPGKPVYHWASIHEDLRRRDFTVNAMAISLNEGSYGLLMDPLNGAADIEARTLRLVSNYGFLDEPALLLRATRLRARLGWELDPRSQARYENAREEGVISALSTTERNRELEQIGHEDDGLKVLEAHEAEGWMKILFPAWTHAKADRDKLQALHDLSVDLLAQGVHADMSGAQMQLLTAKMPAKDLAALKRHMLREGFVEEWNSLDSIASAFQKVLLAKENHTPSATFKLFTSYDPEAVLWLGFTAKSEAVKERYRLFLHEWPEARQRIPYAQMLEMRITPELPIYNELLHKIFLELIDGKLTTPEEIQAFLEPFSPPAPPPQVTVKRSRARRSAEARAKERTFEDEEEADETTGEDGDLDDIDGEDEEDFAGLDLHDDTDEESDEEGEEAEEEAERVEQKHGKKLAKTAKPAKVESAKAKDLAEKSKPEPHPAKKPVPAKAKETAKVATAKAKPAPPVKKEAKATPEKKPATKTVKPAKPAAKKPVKSTAPAAKAKPAAKPAKKATSNPTKAAKPSAKKSVSKSGRKR